MEVSCQLHAFIALPPGKWPHASCVSPRAGLDAMEKRNFLLLPEIEPRLLGRRFRSLVAVPTELFRRSVDINAVCILCYLLFVENISDVTEVTSYSE
jgi:hypothetical protein